MKKLKKIMIIILIILNTFILSSCWNYRETKNMAIVAGAAIDRDEIKDKYILTTEILQFEPSGEQNSITSKIFVTEGETLSDAVRDILTKKGQKPYWSHAKVVIVSKQIAQENILPVIDYISRDAEIRGDIKLFISKQNTAGEILNKEDKKNKEIISFGIDDTVNYNQSLSKFPEVNLWNFMQELGRDGSSSIVTSIDRKKESEEEMVMVYGSYAFKGDKAIGWLDSKESKATLFIKNKIKYGILPLTTVVNGVKYKNDLEIFKNNTIITPVYENKKLSLDINVKTDVGIASVGGNINFMEEENRRMLQKDAEKLIKTNIEKIIYRAQHELHSDIFGFASVIKRDTPKEWRKIQPNWNKEFQEMNTNVNVKVNIVSYALRSKSIRIGEAK